MEHAQRDEYNKLNGTKRVVLILILMEHAQRDDLGASRTG